MISDRKSHQFLFFKIFTAILLIADRNYSHGGLEPVHYMLAMLGAGLLFNLRSGRLFVVYLIAQIAMCVFVLPLVGNNDIFIALVNFYILCQFLRYRKTKENQDQIFTKILPDLRCFVVVLYLCAAFHKLNSDFFNLTESCVVHIYSIFQSRWLSFFPAELKSIFIQPLMVLTFIVEAFLPVFLLLKRLRVFAMIGLILFHAFLGARYFEFSLTSYAFFFLFMPESFLQRLYSIVKNDSVYLRPTAIIFIKINIVLWCLLLSNLLPLDFIDRTVKGWLWLGMVMVVIFELCRMGVFKKLTFQKEQFSLKMSGFGGVICLWLLINGLAPYLGIKTVGAFAMYSNLRTEQYSNHYIIPKGLLQFVDYQDDLVEVLDTNVPDWKLREATSQSFLLPLFEVNSLISGFQERAERSRKKDRIYHIKIYRLQDKKKYTYEFYLDEPLLNQNSIFQHVSWWKRKVFSYHYVNAPSQPTQCRW